MGKRSGRPTGTPGSGHHSRHVRERVERFGLRVVCEGCGFRARHFQRHGRLRDKRCPKCNGKLSALHMVLRRKRTFEGLRPEA